MYGVYQTVCALRLDYKALNRRVVGTAGALAPGSAPTLVEQVGTGPERPGRLHNRG